ncbi:MAG: hypothetical protein ACFFC3_06220, partial [Candidatus Odinarchaeota archaeon]
MTIRDKLTGSENCSFKNVNQDKDNIDDLGLTKEQLLLNDLKTIAKEYLEIEKLKTSFADIILKNLDNLDFNQFIDFPRFHIKEPALKKKVSSANIQGLNVVSVDGSSVTKKFMNVDFSFLKAIAVKYYFQKNHNANIVYYPDLSGFNNYYVQGNFLNRDDTAIETKISIDMTFMEINLLNRLIK